MSATDFLPNASKLCMVAADGGGGLSLLAYDKDDPGSWKGKRLMRRGAAHVGALVTRLQRLRMDVPGDSANR